MLEKPTVPDNDLIAAVRDAFGVHATRLAFLPLGADVSTAVYRVTAADGRDHFLKLRRGGFEEITVAVPHYLHEQGVAAVIDPIAARTGRLWAWLDPYALILYPFVEGKNGYEVALSDRQWLAFGAALRRIHSLQLPAELAGQIPQEDFSPRWRDAVRQFQALAQTSAFADPVAARLAAFMQQHRAEIDHVTGRATQLARALQARAYRAVLCHTDVHPGNLLLGENDALHIVDWDNPLLAPKERDLMYIGAGMAAAWDDARSRQLFYQGYGAVDLDADALAYYRYERIVEDIAAFSAQLFSSAGAVEDREQSYVWFTGQFLPGHEIDSASKSDPEYRA